MTVIRTAAAAIAAFGLFSSTCSLAQQPKREKWPHFEVASIKPGDPRQESSSSSAEGQAGGHWRLVNMPLRQWVEMAFSIPDFALKAPDWLDDSSFDLDAKFPMEKQPDQKAAAGMMKSLLVDRFGFKWHAEVQSIPGYQLVSDRNVLLGPAQRERQHGGHDATSGPGTLTAKTISMSELAEELGAALGAPVIDTTHLPGRYDISLKWRDPDESESAGQKPKGAEANHLPSSLPEALREQLGMRLQSADVPYEVIVVDHIDTQPVPE